MRCERWSRSDWDDALVDPLLSEARDTAKAIRARLYVADLELVGGLRALDLGDAVAAECRSGVLANGCWMKGTLVCFAATFCPIGPRRSL